VSEALSYAPVDAVRSFEATRRRLTARQAEVVSELVRATELEIEAVGYPGLTVRNVARRAGVAPATAYNYFSSKDHLLAETLWRRLQLLPAPLADVSRPVGERVAATIRQLGLGTDDSPALVAACTAALLSSSPDVRAVRIRIGAEIHRRLVVALGVDEGPEAAAGQADEALAVLEITYFGAMLTAGLGHLAFADLPELLATAARRIVGETGE
jgi:AcrR family transcriptional regulator